MTNKTEPAELLPCPFCGIPYQGHWQCAGGAVLLYSVPDKHEQGCPIRVMMGGGHYLSEPEAITAWNTRHHSEPAADVAGNKQAFCEAVWQTLKGDHNDLRKQALILKAFRAALSAMPAPSAEPVGWLYTDPSGKTEIFVRGRWCFHEKWVDEGWTEIPLYTTPQPTPAQVRAEALLEAAALVTTRMDRPAKPTESPVQWQLSQIRAAILALIGDAQ